ncbi:MAG: carbon starvation protein A, partial [Planctomycetes bacterium]|nr:carbon starvation protein A [Planctomycetota bacterium]
MWGHILFDNGSGPTTLHAMPILLGALCVLAIAYRYYSAFLAARVAALDDSRPTPAYQFRDGQNYHPTNKWVLFGHHFAAISGAGPLIGPVLAIQYGYLPGLLWLLIGVCLAGGVQDMLVLAASVRHGGKSLAEIARIELGRPAAVIVSAAILFIIVVALAGLGFVVVKALGGEDVGLADGTRITLPAGQTLQKDSRTLYRFPEGCAVHYTSDSAPTLRSESFRVAVPEGKEPAVKGAEVVLPAGAKELVPGSSWGTFTIACTIPIALFMGWYMYRLRKGRVLEASLIGAVGVLAAVVIGNWVPGSPLEKVFSLSRNQTILALAGYGFVASVLPVWILLCPRDYLSSFLKIGTIALLVVGVIIANPALRCPPINHQFENGGPTFKGAIFPFVFICIMCGSISGFHALVASGTTPKMVEKESHIRTIGYGAMLMEGLVGIVALIAAAGLGPKLYFEINTSLPEVPHYQKDLDSLYASLSQMDVEDRDLADVQRLVGGEALRGRTGGAVTLAVGMAQIFTRALDWTRLPVEAIMKYWYHFAIMFEALFILTTVDTGTRIARFLLQEALGAVHPRFERTDWLPGALLATLVVTAGWALLIKTGSISTIWPMFGIANQLLSVVALALVTTWLINTQRARYALVTILPMVFVTATTMTAGAQLISDPEQFPNMIERGRKLIQLGQTAAGNELVFSGMLNIGLTVFVITCVGLLLLLAIGRW